MPILRVDLQRVAGAPGDVREVAEERALVPLFNVGVRARPGFDAVEEVPVVRGVVEGPRAAVDLLAVRIVNLVPRSIQNQRPLLAVKRNPEAGPLEPALVPAVAFVG